MKFCINCKHYKEDRCCRHIVTSLVNGAIRRTGHLCYHERESGIVKTMGYGLCGKSGRFFVPKEVSS